MRNRILYITRNTIPYVKEIMPIAKTVTGCILMQQLDYWFERYPEGFWKFQDTAPKHAWYKPGESWCEELGFSVREFRTAFDKIGVRYESKKEWLKSGMNFDGKFYACFIDRRNGGITYYFRNHSLLDEALDHISERVETKGPVQRTQMPGGSMKGAPGQFPQPQVTDFAPNAKSAFTVNALSASTVNAGSQSTVNTDSASTVNGDSQSPVNAESAVHEVANRHSQQMPIPHLGYTETTYKDYAEKKPQPSALEQTPELVDNSAERRGGGLDFETPTTKPKTPAEFRGSSPAMDSHLAPRPLDPSAQPPDLIFPGKVLPLERTELEKQIVQCPAEYRQAVLDEVAGAHAKGTLRVGVVPFARSLVIAVNAGKFTPHLSVEVRAARESLARIQDARASAEARVHLAVQNDLAHLTDAQLKLLPPNMRRRAQEGRARQQNASGGVATTGIPQPNA